jgi:hypothetical protein
MSTNVNKKDAMLTNLHHIPSETTKKVLFVEDQSLVNTQSDKTFAINRDS